MKNVNNWNSFSRGLCVALLAIAVFCGICGLGAALNQIPWLLIAGGICILLIISTAIWYLGYKSKSNHPTRQQTVSHTVVIPVAPKDIKDFNMFDKELFDDDQSDAGGKNTEEE